MDEGGAVSFRGFEGEGELGPGLALAEDDFLLLLLLPLTVLLQLHALLVNLSLLLHYTQLLLSLSDTRQSKCAAGTIRSDKDKTISFTPMPTNRHLLYPPFSNTVSAFLFLCAAVYCSLTKSSLNQMNNTLQISQTQAYIAKKSRKETPTGLLTTADNHQFKAT